MLIILAGVPVTTPGEAVFFKELIAKIIFVYLIREILGAVNVYLTSFGRDIVVAASCFVKDNVRVVKGIDVNGTADGMFA